MDAGVSRQKKDGNLDYDGFTTLVRQLMDAAWGQDWGVFLEAYPSSADGKQAVLPAVVCSIVKMEPALITRDIREVKPRFREQIMLQEDADHHQAVDVFGQRMEYIVEFELVAGENKTLDQLSKAFRDLMMVYTGYLMKRGAQQLRFVRMEPKKQSTKEDMVSRSHLYQVILEELAFVPRDKILSVITELDNLGSV